MFTAWRSTRILTRAHDRRVRTPLPHLDLLRSAPKAEDVWEIDDPATGITDPAGQGLILVRTPDLSWSSAINHGQWMRDGLAGHGLHAAHAVLARRAGPAPWRQRQDLVLTVRLVRENDIPWVATQDHTRIVRGTPDAFEFYLLLMQLGVELYPICGAKRPKNVIKPDSRALRRTLSKLEQIHERERMRAHRQSEMGLATSG